MRFKNIYVEITNICNMNCPFCKKETRKKKSMTAKDFDTVINKIKNYTECVYLHVKGEPLIHKELDNILTICDNNNIYVNITTNGTLLKERASLIIKHKCIRQINISLHSNLNNDEYLNNIFYVTDYLLDKTNIYMNYRLWNIYEETDFVNKINKYYNTDITKTNKLKKNLFIEMEHEFNWPKLTNKYYNEYGKCYGLINQLAILVNGDIVPCCLDSEAIIKLGNIYEDNLDDILNSKKSLTIINGFRCNKKEEELCKHCDFLENRNR